MYRLLTTSSLLTAALALPAVGQTTIISDSMDRTDGLNEAIIDGGFSAWGMADNAFGGNVSGLSYVLADDAGFRQTIGFLDLDNDPNTPDEGVGQLRFGRGFLDYNLATNADIVSAGGVSIQYDINPTDRGGAGFNGRDWGGIGLVDTKSLTSIGQRLGLALGNEDSRVSFLPRNSGSAIFKSFTDSGLFNANSANGNPANGAITETILDQPTADAYLTYFNDAGGDPIDDPFDAPQQWYTVRMEITADSGTIFADGGDHTVKVFVGPQGGALSQVNLDTGTPALESSLVWGDNMTQAAAGGGDDTPSVNDAYLFFAGNGDTHLFDNLIIESLGGGTTVITGDYDTSGQVEQGDLDIVLQNWGTGTFTGDEAALAGGGPFDGTVDQNELDGVLQNWGSTSAPDFAGSAVPEPAALALLGVGGLAVLRRRG